MQNVYKVCIGRAKTEEQKILLLTFLALTILRVKFEIKDEFKAMNNNAKRYIKFNLRGVEPSILEENLR